MDDANQLGFKPPPEFQEDARAPLLELNASDSSELWLIQWPKDQLPDFDGQQISLDLHLDKGQLGTFEGSSGKSYDVVSLAAQEPKATVFVSSASDSKIVGKISRRVSLVHYLEPSEVPKDDTKKLKELYERSTVTSVTNSGNHFTTPSKSIKRGHSRSTHSSGHKSSLSDEKVQSKSHTNEPTTSVHDQHSSQDKAKKRKKHKGT